MFRLHSQIHVQDAVEAFAQKPRADQQDHGRRQFENHHVGAAPSPHRSRRSAAAFGQSVPQVRPDSQARDHGEQHSGQKARYKLADDAERELRKLAKARQVNTGEGYYQAYAAVLLENPGLYEQYQKQRATAARGTPFESTLKFPVARTE
jgi:hypothetical protein